MATNAAAQNAIKKKLVQRLEVRLGREPGARAWAPWEERRREGPETEWGTAWGLS